MRIMRIAAVSLLLRGAPAAFADVAYPGLPKIAFSTMPNAETTAKIKECVSAANAHGLWNEHLAACDAAVTGLTATAASWQRESKYKRTLGDPVASTILSQAAFLRFVTPRVLKTASKGDAGSILPGFLDWLMFNAAAVETFLCTAQPEDNLAKALALWAGLWKDKVESRDKYLNLAIACALVFDGPAFGVNMTERYEFFKASNERRKLGTHIEDMSAKDLTWVVDAPISDKELLWAQKNVRLPRANWAAAYDMVKYRMDKASGKGNIYDEYTLEEILKKGGVCSDRAYFAAMTAKANGIPAMPISGEGRRGAHAWFGYKATEDRWNMEAGRFAVDFYVAGTTRNPQTGQVMKEGEIVAATAGERDTRQYRDATRLLWIAECLASSDRPDDASFAFDAALRTYRRHLPAVMAYLRHLISLGAPEPATSELIKSSKRDFRDYADIVNQLSNIEISAATARNDTNGAMKITGKLIRDLRRDPEGRTDLIVENIQKQAAMKVQANDIKGAMRVFRDALRDYGKVLTAFREISEAYFEFACSCKEAEQAARDIDLTFSSCYRAQSQDYFEIKTRAQTMLFVAECYERAGNESKAKRFRSDSERLMERAAAIGERSGRDNR